jgi:hypothetical protein
MTKPFLIYERKRIVYDFAPDPFQMFQYRRIMRSAVYSRSYDLLSFSLVRNQEQRTHDGGMKYVHLNLFS